MPKGPLKPTHRAVTAYYDTLAQFGDQHVVHETAVRSAFQTLLADTARAHGWTLIPELSAGALDPNRDREGAAAPLVPSRERQRAIEPNRAPPEAPSAPEPSPGIHAGVSAHTIRPDGTIRDANSLPRGYWEAKDTADDLDAEIVKKDAKGYSLVNTIFEDTRTAVLFQGKREVFRADLHEPQQLCDLLNLFYTYTEPDIADFEQAVDEFKQRVPELARGLPSILAAARRLSTSSWSRQTIWGRLLLKCPWERHYDDTLSI
jgi:hypothetical protein